MELEMSINQLNPFLPNAPCLYPLKTSENNKGVDKGCIGKEWVKQEFYLTNLQFFKIFGMRLFLSGFDLLTKILVLARFK